MPRLKGSKTMTQVTVGTSAVKLLDANDDRISALIENNGTVPIYLGASNAVTTGTGFELAAGDTLSDTNSSDAWWAISGTTGQTVSVVEVA